MTLTANKDGQIIIIRDSGKRVRACDCVYGAPEIKGFHGMDQPSCREKCGPSHCAHIDNPSHIHLAAR